MKKVGFLLLILTFTPILPANAYIDPATGGMLFSVFLGAVTTLFFLAQSLFFKLKLLFNKKELCKETLPFIVYSEGKQYWRVFRPILDEFEKREIPVTFYTSAEDDPVFSGDYAFVKSRFIGKGNKAFFKLAFAKADVCLMTTPGLDVFQLKRSKSVAHYAHVLHSASDATRYKLFGLDYFDSVFLNGDFQVEQIRALERKRKLPKKELPVVGCTYLDDLRNSLRELPENPEKSNKFTVLVAPTWGESSLLNKYGAELLDKIVNSGKNIIIRPHPQSLAVEKGLIEMLKRRYEGNSAVVWDFSPDNLPSLSASNVMISDFSGVIFDYAFLFKKPFIFVNEKLNTEIYDISDCDVPLFALEKIKDLGIELTEDNFDKIGELVENACNDASFAEKAEALKNLIWQHRGEAAKNIVDFLVEKQREAHKC